MTEMEFQKSGQMVRNGRRGRKQQIGLGSDVEKSGGGRSGGNTRQSGGCLNLPLGLNAGQ